MRAVLIGLTVLLTAVAVEAQSPVPLSIPDTIVYRDPGMVSGVPITVPVEVGVDVTGRGIQAVDVVVRFDPAVVDLATFTLGSLVPNGCAVFGGTDTGEINVRIACGSSTPLAGGPGVLVTFEGTLVAEGATALTFDNTNPFNEGNVEADIADGRLRIVTDPDPSIGAIDAQQTDEDTAFTTEITIGDNDTDLDELTITAQAADASLIDGSAFTVGLCEGEDATSSCRTLSGTPAADASGQTTVTVTVSDNDARSSDVTETFVLTVAAVNDAPRVASALDDRTARAGTDPIVIDLASFLTDVDDETLVYTASSSDTDLARTTVTGDTLRVELIGAGAATITVRATDTAGLFVEDTFELTLSSGVASDDDAPLQLALRGPAPNPATASTDLRFDLPRTAVVRVEVYDSVGRRVLDIAPRTVSAGLDRRIALSLGDQPAGIYLYRILVEQGSASTAASGQIIVVR